MLAALHQRTWTDEEIAADVDGEAYDAQWTQGMVGALIVVDGLLDLRRIYLALTKT